MNTLLFKTDKGIVKIVPEIVKGADFNVTLGKEKLIFTWTVYLNEIKHNGLSMLSKEQYKEFVVWRENNKKTVYQKNKPQTI